jgi:cytosine/adenosine deaminase-related metal-dependent hydrolase
LKVVTAQYILICDNKFEIIENGAIVYSDKIIDVDSISNIIIKYPELDIKEPKPYSVLMPGLINTHLHLEFSKNSTTLKYGDFLVWLNSVIKSRDALIQDCNKEFLDEVLTKVAKSGTTTIGAVSSYGLDLEACSSSKLKVVFFNEAIGSKPDMVDMLFKDFLQRYEASTQEASSRLIPAIAIHSPYSIHPILTDKILDIASLDGVVVSTHFMESQAEKQWCESSSGDFKEFFKNFLNQNSSLIDPISFLKQFKDVKTLFTHSVESSDDMLKVISELDASITHCPTSNRLLNNTILDISKVDKNGINLSMGTDGLSSNYSLNMFEEIKNALFMHTQIPLNELAKKLILSSTNFGAKALGLNSGSLEKSKDADFIYFTLPNSCNTKEELATAIIIHTKEVERNFVNGERVV